jgi:hypothetical protein
MRHRAQTTILLHTIGGGVRGERVLQTRERSGGPVEGGTEKRKSKKKKNAQDIRARKKVRLAEGLKNRPVCASAFCRCAFAHMSSLCSSLLRVADTKLRSKLYCSRECQRLDWLNGHKQECPQLAAKQNEGSGALPAAAAGAATGTAAGRSSTAAAASPTHAQQHGQAPHRNYALNVNVSFGPRTIFAILVVLYLIYRYSYRSSSATAAPHESHAVG